MKMMDGDLAKIKKSKFDMQEKIKSESDKFNKYKQSTQKEISNTKKKIGDQDKTIFKMKNDLKKTD
jgi:hypothetical protein